jgi:branched-chain amino acid transport system substrate-binding protein
MMNTLARLPMNRHRFWTLGVILALVATVAQAQTPFRAPQQNQSLAPTSGYTPSPARNSVGDAPGWGKSAAAPQEKTTGPETIVKVGLLLPLTGRNAELGKTLHDSATVALFDQYARLSPKQQSTRVVLVAKDTGDTPQQAALATAAAIDEGAQFLIGPVFSEETEASAAIAKAQNITMLSLSNNRARASQGVFTFGFSPQEQAARVVNYAITSGKTRIAVLSPRSALGEAVLAATRVALKDAGLDMAAEAQYAAQGVGIEAALNTLVPPGTEPKFDALLLPESGPALDTILHALAGRGVRPGNMQFLGTGIWDDAALLKRVNLESAWLASSSPSDTAMFENRFKTTYKYVPPRVASLTYDAVALAVTLATSQRGFEPVILTNPSGFKGPANGLYRLRADGTVERGLAVIQVEGGNLKVISKAPSLFIN